MNSAFLLSIFLFGIVRSSDIDNEIAPTEDYVKRGLTNKCMARETSSCVAIELVGYVDRMLRTASVQLSDDVLIVDESDGAAAETPVRPESLARAGVSLEDQAQQLIMDKLWSFGTTRSLRYRILDNADVVISGQQEKDGSFGVGVSMKEPKLVESGRGRNKNIGPFLAAAAVKFGLLGALTFKGLTLMVGKALLISKIALLLATIIGLKKLFSPQVMTCGAKCGAKSTTSSGLSNNESTYGSCCDNTAERFSLSTQFRRILAYTKRNHVTYEVFTDPHIYYDWDYWRRNLEETVNIEESQRKYN